ncbi:hypothetical protein GALMADRAFT_145457 [Galerina marginata CBS 339.88]|uniref:BTB domain-containing protein n=1 Tax=Galerina marginata (strain CBS 339.88) TaxID=685588 RepID=A0A067SEQ6_GALM3|nr:hypothetical protein GALMADRAFT_145457 [Galerina marginata CBS 339.88]
MTQSAALDALRPLYELVMKDSTRLWEQELKTIAFTLNPSIHLPDTQWEKRQEMELRDEDAAHSTMTLADQARYYDSTPEHLSSISVDSGHMYSGSPSKAAPVRYRAEFRLIDGGRHLYFIIRSCSTFADVKITVPTRSNHPAAFLSYSFILSARSPYFRRVLLAQRTTVAGTHNTEDPPTTLCVALPESSFTPESFSFILSYLYSGNLKVTRQECDLYTALDIYRGSIFLELPVLRQLVKAQIMVETLHGLYHAPLSNTTYSNLSGNEWSTMVALGCRCRTCICRTPVVLQFAFGLRVSDDILPFITPPNIFPLLFEAEKALLHLERLSGSVTPAQRNRVRPRILAVRDLIDEVFYAHPGACFASRTWNDMINDIDGDENEKVAKVHWITEAISRAKAGQSAATILRIFHSLASTTRLYRQVSVSGLANSPIQSQIERTMIGLLKMMPLSTQIELVTPVMLQSQASLKETPRRNSSVESIYSDISMSTANFSALDLYSLASSRTASTDYGLYYTRWAISQDTIQE